MRFISEPSFGTCLRSAVASLCLLASATVAPAAVPMQDRATPYVVVNDYGGSVQARLVQIRELRRSGRPIEIRGSVCYSSCTMLLGLGNTCVEPGTMFGFHAPSRSGTPLPRPVFEQVSRLIAASYPEQLRGWYLDEARYADSGLRVMRGSDLIDRRIARAC